MKSHFREIACRGEKRGTVVAIPGGPGLSCHTLPLGFLCDDFRVVFLDPPGCGSVSQPEFGGPSYDFVYRKVVDSLVREIESATTASERTILLGHSYGGIMAADALSQLVGRPLMGLAMLASPFTEHLYSTVLQEQIHRYGSPVFYECQKAYVNDPCLVTYHDYACSYDLLLASADRRSLATILTLLREDPSCAVAMRRCSKCFQTDTDYEGRIMRHPAPKLAIAGSEDQLLPLAEMTNECRRLNIPLRAIAGAGHFPHLDAPDHVRQVLVDFVTDICAVHPLD